MITLSKSGNSVTFTFVNNGHYLANGTIDVPVNSLILVTDESEMATFKKLDGDPFISCLYGDLGMTKAELISWYEENMVGSTGGGGVTSGEVESMISSATTDFFNDVEYDSEDKAIYFYNGEDIKATIDASDFVIDGMVDNVEIQTISGASYLVIEFNTASGKEDIQIPVTSFFDASQYYTKAEVDAALSAATNDMATQTWVGQQDYVTQEYIGVNYPTYSEVEETVAGAISGKADTSAVTASINAAVSGKADTSAVTAVSNRLNEVDEVAARALVDLDERKADTSAMTASLSGKQDTLIAGSGITISGNVISSEGGGATYSAGRGIAINTGNTISFSLPMYNYGNSNIQYYSTDNTFSYYSSNSGKFRTNQVNGSGNTISATSTSINGVFCNYINGDKNSIKLQGNGAKGQYNFIVGYNNNLYANSMMNPTISYNFVLGRSNSLGGSESIVAGFSNSSVHKNFLFGNYLTSNYELESSFGQYNTSNTGSTDADKTFFSIGNGTADNARHNAFEIRQNGDIYCNNGTADIKLQDYLQIKVMAISQSDYDALVQGGTVDANTLYVITNVVS